MQNKNIFTERPHRYDSGNALRKILDDGDLVVNLEQTISGKPLDATQGKILNDNNVGHLTDPAAHSDIRNAVTTEAITRSNADVQLQGEVGRLSARGQTWGIVNYSQAQLSAMTQINRDAVLNAFILGQTNGVLNGYLVYTNDLENDHEWEYNDTISSWKDNGISAVARATNTNAGIVKGSTEKLKIGVDTDNEMSVNGLEEIIDPLLIKERPVLPSLYSYIVNKPSFDYGGKTLILDVNKYYSYYNSQHVVDFSSGSYIAGATPPYLHFYDATGQGYSKTIKDGYSQNQQDVDGSTIYLSNIQITSLPLPPGVGTITNINDPKAELEGSIAFSTKDMLIDGESAGTVEYTDYEDFVSKVEKAIPRIPIKSPNDISNIRVYGTNYSNTASWLYATSLGLATTSHTTPAATSTAQGHTKLSNGAITDASSSSTFAVSYNHVYNTAVNLDNTPYTYHGEWTFNQITTATNFPGTQSDWQGSGKYFHLKTERGFSTTYIKQTLSNFMTKKSYIRWWQGSTPGAAAWTQVSFDGVSHAHNISEISNNRFRTGSAAGSMNIDTGKWAIGTGIPLYKGSVPDSVFSPSDGEFYICQEHSESSGISFNGSHITMWAPCDSDSLRFYNENLNTTTPVFRIDASGNYYNKAGYITTSLVETANNASRNTSVNSGHRRYSDGLIIKWGRITGDSTWKPINLEAPVFSSSTSYNVFVNCWARDTDRTNQCHSGSVKILSGSSFKIALMYSQSNSGLVGSDFDGAWLAIGY